MFINKKLLSGITAASLIISGLIPAKVATAQEFDLDAEAVKLMEAETGRVLYSENASKSWAPASLTKIMTLIIGLEALEEGEIHLEDEAVTSTQAYNTGGSTMFLNENQEVSIENLLTGIAVVSANDGCIVLAEHLEGSLNSFVDRMNEKAEEIGLENTNFENPHGLPDENQYVTARDIAKLSQYAVNNTPKILELESIPEFTFNIEDPQYNRNLMLPDRNTQYSYEGVDGLKTGRTGESGHNFVGTAERDDMRIIAVVLGAENETERFTIARDLMDYGFGKFYNTTVVEKNEEIDEVQITNGKEREVIAIADSPLKVTTKLQDSEELKWQFEPQEVTAPVEKKQSIGELLIYEEDELIGSVTAVAEEEIEELGFFGKIIRTIRDGITSFFVGIRDTIVDFIFGD